MYNNPFFNQPRYAMPIQNQPVPSATPAPYIQPIQNQMTLTGKYVDSMDVAKASETPLDGSVVFYPFTDGSAIVSKQLQMDGTTKTIVYKPSNDDKKEEVKFATLQDIQDAIEELDLSDIQDLKDDIKEIKKQLKEIKPKKVKED